MPADAGVLEQRSRPRNTTRPDALTRGLSAATAGRDGREGPRGRHGANARGFLPESEEDAEDEDEARVRSGCAAHAAGSCRLGCGDASAAALFLSAADLVLDMRWRRFATGAERVRSGEHDGGGGRRACLPESTEEADEDDEESRERSGRKCVSRRFRHPSALLSSSLAFLELDTRWRRSRHRRPAQRGARGDVGSDAGSTSRHGGGEHGADAGAGRCKGTSFPPEKSSSAAESAAAAAGTTWNSNSSPSASAAAARGAGQ